MILTVWHLIVHVMGADGGATRAPGYGKWDWFYFDSGFGNGSWLLTLSIVALPVYYHHKCHIHHCWRYGRYEAAGGYRVCRKHNPDLQGQPLTMEMLTLLHEEWKKGCHRNART